MTHDEWLAEVKAALALGPRRCGETVARLKRLAARCARPERLRAGEWHAEQSLSLAASTLVDASRRRGGRQGARRERR